MFVNSIPEEIPEGFCEIHGKFSYEYLPFGERFLERNSCAKCSKISEENKKIEEKEKQRALQEKLISEKKFQAGLGQRHFDCTFDNYITDTQDQKKILQIVIDYSDAIANGSAACLVMAGGVGTGKTHLAASIVNKFIMLGKRCLIIKMSELIRDIKDTWRKDSEYSEKAIIRKLSSIELLIIDEIGVQFGSDTEKLLISEVIDNRYQDMVPTILISNLDLSGIKACIGDRSYDRLREDGGKIIALNWQSHRAKK